MSEIEGNVSGEKKKIDWKTVEAKGISHYIEKGFNVLVKLFDNSWYDFVIEKNCEFTRVNVKLAFLNSPKKPNSWVISAPANRKWRERIYSDHVDIFLVWLPHKEKFIEIDGAFFDGHSSPQRTIPKNLKE